MQIEKDIVRIGFNPLTDCASLVMASVLGLDRKHGIRIVLSKETSWAGVRDKLLTGELDAAHALYGLVYATHLGVGSARRDMAILMNLNRNGQAICNVRGRNLRSVHKLNAQISPHASTPVNKFAGVSILISPGGLAAPLKK